MDEIFIKMCAASDEIQSKFTNEIGNLVFSARLQLHNLKEPAILMVGRDTLPFCHGDIWLPRQEQLQKVAQPRGLLPGGAEGDEVRAARDLLRTHDRSID